MYGYVNKLTVNHEDQTIRKHQKKLQLKKRFFFLLYKGEIMANTRYLHASPFANHFSFNIMIFSKRSSAISVSWASNNHNYYY